MSGGHFNYDQYKLEYIADSIQELIASNNDESLNEWGDRVGHGYSADTIAEFEKAVKYLRLAFIYAHRVDWLVSCDDGEDSFHSRLKEELEKFENGIY
jgi:hypothetical protein